MSWTKQPTSGGSSTSKWAGKAWTVIGDSLTEVNFTTTKQYHLYISQSIGCTVQNLGTGGTGYWDRYSTGPNAVTGTPDLITVFLGTNDWYNNRTLGTFGDTGTTTLAGCIYNMLNNLITKFPTQYIAVFTPLPRSDSWGSPGINNSTAGFSLEQVVNMIINYCKYFSIPCLDLYHNANLQPWNTTACKYYYQNSSQVNGDGLHPNEIGHKVLADKILAFLNSL